MLTQHIYLRMYRKRSCLTQSDLAFIMELPDDSRISRWEQGLRKPSIHTLLVYNILFDVPIEAFFELQKHDLQEQLAKRIALYLEELKALPTDKKVASRIEYLIAILNRLTPSQNV